MILIVRYQDSLLFSLFLSLSIHALCKVPSALRIIHGLFPSLLIVVGESVRNRFVRKIIVVHGMYIAGKIGV